jgi:nudix-type nucleoside diphosphatase (YffH/AdpP family)
LKHDIVSVDVIHEGWAKYLLADVRLPSGTVVRRAIEDHGNAVAVLPYEPKRKTAILVRQFRAPVKWVTGTGHTLEAIAGRIEDQDPVATVRREAFEEAGLELASMELVARVWGMPGVSTERMFLFLATYSATNRIAPGGGLEEEHEAIEVAEMNLAELAAMSDAGELDDMKTLALVQALRIRSPELFTL